MRVYRVRAASWVGTIVLALAALAPGHTVRADQSLSYGSQWRHMQIPGSVDPALWTLAYDDSWWPSDVAPFVGAGACVAPGTLWDGYRTLFRKTFYWSGPSYAGRGHLVAEAVGAVYVNGVEVLGFGMVERCVTYDLPVGIQPGYNVIAVWANETQPVGCTTCVPMFDMQVDAPGATAARGVSWGQLKLHYR